MNAAAKMIHQSNLFSGEFADLRFSMKFCWQMILLAAVLLSAFAVIYSTNLHRETFCQLQQATQKKHELQLQWGQLLLEQESLSTPRRIQDVAAKILGMKTPTSQQIIILRVP